MSFSPCKRPESEELTMPESSFYPGDSGYNMEPTQEKEIVEPLPGRT